MIDMKITATRVLFANIRFGREISLITYMGGALSGFENTCWVRTSVCTYIERLFIPAKGVYNE